MKKAFFSSLTIFTLLFTAVFTLSAFEAPDEADGNGAAGMCYVQTYYDCSGGGFGSSCTFTGIYGSPYTCLSYGCGVLGYLLRKSRECVLKIQP